MPSAHACDDGSHGCHNLSAGGICVEVGPDGWACDCDKHYRCVQGCSGAHSAHQCTLITEAPSPSPTGSPSRGPTGAPRAPPTAAPTAWPSPGPTEGPSERSTSAAPEPTVPSPSGQQCTAAEYRAPSGDCAECTADLVPGGCIPAGGGYPAPSADKTACICNCRFFWTGSGCDTCPPGYGGFDCDRCAAGDAEPPQCEPPRCADPGSLPGEVMTECGGGARELALQPALYHKGFSATVTIAVASQGQPPQLTLPERVPVQQLGGGALAVQGAELQLTQWLHLRILPAAALTHTTPITFSVNITSVSCVPLRASFTVRCPAPKPRVSGSLPAAAVHEGDEVTVPCALSELAHVDYPFSVRSDPPGVISYDHSKELCTVHSAALPSPPPASGTTAVLTVAVPGAEVPLPLHIEVIPAECGSGARSPLYIQMPPGGTGSESTGSVSLGSLKGPFKDFQLIGESGGVQVQRLGDSLRVIVGNEAVEGTFHVRLFYSVGSVECVEVHPVRTFWGPSIAGPDVHIRQAVGVPFTHVLETRAVASTGSPPWCPEPTLRITQQPGGLELAPRGTEWELSGSIHTPGLQFAYITATDCRGGSARIRVELYGVAGTVLGPLPEASYLEDVPLRLPLPSVLSTAKELTLSVAPRADAQLQLGTLRADCPAGVNVTQKEPGLALSLGGSPAQLRQCAVTLAPAADSCEALRLVWRAAGQAQEQVLAAVCGPDPPVATPQTTLVRWGDYVEAQIPALVHSVDHDQCLRVTAEPNKTKRWLERSGSVIGGYAPREEVTECQEVNTYTCRTNLGAQTRFCVTSLPDARVWLAPMVIDCIEDTPCWLYQNISIEPTELTRNDTPLALVVSSHPPVLRNLQFNATPADTPEVRPSGAGHVRVEDTYKRLWLQMHKARVVVAPDFDGTVDIAVRGAVGTAVGEAGPITIRFTPVNDAPRCNGTGGCNMVKVSCGLISGDQEDLDGYYKDVDDPKLAYHANDTSFGVKVVGNLLVCSSFMALLTFYGVPYSGSAKVFATDPSGAVSPVLEVEVDYELTKTETVTVLIVTIVFSVYGTFLLVFRPGSLAAIRNRRRKVAGGGRPGKMVCRVGREAAAQLRDAGIKGAEVFQAGCGLWWLCDNGGITKLAEGLRGGGIVVQDCGENCVIGAQPESAFDPDWPLFCAVVGPKRLQMGDAPNLSVLHEDPEAELKLCLRLRNKGGNKAVILWTLGLARIAAAACGTGPDITEYTGTAQQVTEWAHMHRIVGTGEGTTELVWTLSEAKSDRPFIGGAVPVGTTGGEASLCGADGAASPQPTAALATPADAPAGGGPNPLSQPLLPDEQQQGKAPACSRPTFRRHATAQELQELREELKEMVRGDRAATSMVHELRNTVQQLKGGTPQQEAARPLPSTQPASSALRGGPLSPPLHPTMPSAVPASPPQGGGGPRPLVVTPKTPQLPGLPPPRGPSPGGGPPMPQQSSQARPVLTRTPQRVPQPGLGPLLSPSPRVGAPQQGPPAGRAPAME